MIKLEVFDPAMCCATGICGNSVDPKLVTFASDLEWLKKQGIDVVRHGLSFEPAEFVKNEAVKNTLQSDGNESLPMIVLNNEIVSKACYPTREKLAKICNIEYNEDSCCCGSECDCQSSNKTPVKENSCCGPDCDCHKSALSNTAKKVLFIFVVIAMLAIIAFKMSPKAHAIGVKPHQTTNKSVSSFGEYINSLNQIKPSQEVAYVYIPSQSNGKISNDTKAAVLSAKKTLEGKNIKVFLYTLNSSSPEYNGIVAQTKAQSIIAIYKAGNKFAIVLGDVTTTKLLQAYMTAKLAGNCGAGCPCHKK